MVIVLTFRPPGQGRGTTEKLFSIIMFRIPVSKVFWKNHNSNLLHIAKEIANDNLITMYRKRYITVVR